MNVVPIFLALSMNAVDIDNVPSLKEAGFREAPRGASLPWKVAPFVCHAVDGGTALWAHSHRAGWQERNLVNTVNSPAKMIMLKLGTAALTTAGVHIFNKAKKPLIGKLLVGGTCIYTMYGAGTNVGWWNYNGPLVGKELGL